MTNNAPSSINDGLQQIKDRIVVIETIARRDSINQHKDAILFQCRAVHGLIDGLGRSQEKDESVNFPLGLDAAIKDALDEIDDASIFEVEVNVFDYSKSTTAPYDAYTIAIASESGNNENIEAEAIEGCYAYDSRNSYEACGSVTEIFTAETIQSIRLSIENLDGVTTEDRVVALGGDCDYQGARQWLVSGRILNGKELAVAVLKKLYEKNYDEQSALIAMFSSEGPQRLS